MSGMPTIFLSTWPSVSPRSALEKKCAFLAGFPQSCVGSSAFHGRSISVFAVFLSPFGNTAVAAWDPGKADLSVIGHTLFLQSSAAGTPGKLVSFLGVDLPWSSPLVIILRVDPAHVAGGERRPILRLRHCLPSWFTVHSQAMLHFPQSPRHGQRAQQPMPRAWRVAFAGDKALRIFQQLALRVRDAKR